MRWLNIPVLWDLDARLAMMKKFRGYRQVLTLSLPAIEYLAGPDESPALARLANEGMAEIVAEHPAQFPAFVASLPMNNVPAALEEMDYAIGKLGAKGIQIFTNVNGRPLDDPEFYPVFERCVKKYDLPIWLHPVRRSDFPDYLAEKKSKYEIWWLFGWPYETSACMARMVFSGMLEKLPNMKIITHHLGAMAPYFDERIALGMDQMGTRTPDEDYVGLRTRMEKSPLDLLQDVLRRHLGQRLGARDPLRARFLRRRPRAVRHRLPVRPGGRADLHTRDHTRDRLAQARGAGPAQGLLRQRDPDAAARYARACGAGAEGWAQSEEKMTLPGSSRRLRPRCSRPVPETPKPVRTPADTVAPTGRPPCCRAS